MNRNIDELLTRGVANIIPSKELLKKNLSERKLNIYFGVDPTATHLHLGNAIHLIRLNSLAQMGHNVTFLIGDFTALIGDTSDKESERPILSPKDIESNWQEYQNQASKIVDFSKVKVVRNSQWLSALDFKDIIKLVQSFTLNDFISRELIKKRLSTPDSSVRLDEVLYPVMQGYDSYYLDTDLQIGGTDQTFNMQSGRVLQKKWRQKESFVLSGEFLEGTDGRKMSKSWDNAIWLDDSPSQMYGKIMSLKDDLIKRYFDLTTTLSNQEISDILSSNPHPMDQKKALAHHLVSTFHDSQQADLANEAFKKQFQDKSLPQDIPSIATNAQNITDLILETGAANSKSEARRLIDQNAVKINDTKADLDSVLPASEFVLRVGPRKIYQILPAK